MSVIACIATLEEQLVNVRLPMQVEDALGELGIVSIAAHSPQAKGRVEWLWADFQNFFSKVRATRGEWP